MKKSMMALFMSLMVVGTAWCIEEPEGHPQEGMFALKFNDEQQKSVSSALVRRLQNLMPLVAEQGLISKGSRNLPISSSEWDKLMLLLVEGDTDAVLPVVRTCEEITNFLKKLSLTEMLTYLSLVDFFDPLCDEETSVIDLFVPVLVEKIKADPDSIISLLQKGQFIIPTRIESQIAQALLKAKKIIRDSYEKINIRDRCSKLSIAWSSKERLAVGCSNGAIIVEPNGNRTLVITQDWGSIDSVAWSARGDRLALVRFNRVIIVEQDGAITPVEALGLGQIYSVAWSSDDRLAVGGDHGLIIVEPNGKRISVKTQGLGAINSVAWSYDGRLAVSGENDMIIVGPDGAITPVTTQDWGFTYSVAWSARGDRLALGSINRVIIVGPDGAITPVEALGLGIISSVAWSSDGRLAVGGENGAIIMEPNGAITSVATEDLGRIRDVAWSSGGRLAVGGFSGAIIYNGDIPQEYNNLSISQALLIINLAGQEGTRYLNDEENTIYESLPAKIKERYPAIPILLD